MERLTSYFRDGISSRTLETIGAEIETQLVNEDGAISVDTSQSMLKLLAHNGWNVDAKKGSLISAIRDKHGNKIFYELGRHNLEVATAPVAPSRVVREAYFVLDQVYDAARKCYARPLFAPIFKGTEDLLVIPDERDQSWLELDGRDALAPLARTSSVQFTISIYPEDAIKMVNAFCGRISQFLGDFPQDSVWRTYIRESRAKYRADRYGGPLHFASLYEYASRLSEHDIVSQGKLIPYHDLERIDIPLFIRSVWWHFRLKRYGDALCLEVRPMARRLDTDIPDQLKMVLDIAHEK